MIKGDFQAAIIGFSPTITQVLCITISALLTKREVKMAGYWRLILSRYRCKTTEHKIIVNKRQSVTASGYCFIFVEYCSKIAMLYKFQRGE